MSQKTCLVILGPTAVGKTALSIKVARFFSTQIISADSRQCFKELNIGVAKPSADQLQEVPHYFINSHSIHDKVNAAVFEQYALSILDKIFEHSDVAVMVGGTGLYIRAFCDGMDEVPVIDPAVRINVRKEYNRQGLEWLQEQVRSLDPVFYSDGEVLNPHRLLRSLEVILSTGRSIRTFQTGQKISRNFSILQTGLELPREELYTNINQRVDKMMEQGLAEEVRDLIPYRHLQPVHTIGYRELIECFEQQGSVNEAVQKIKTNTRHYAKRQMTWFKKDERITWFQAGEEEKNMQYIKEKMDEIPDLPLQGGAGLGDETSGYI